MNEAIAVEINEGIERRFERGASLGIAERTLGNNLGKVFLGVLHDHVQTIPVLEAAAADGEDAEQMGMNKLHGAAPQRELEVGGRTGGEGIAGGFFWLGDGGVREGNGGGVRAPSESPPAGTPLPTPGPAHLPP